MANALDRAPTMREGNHVLDPVGPGRYAPIDPADTAAVAALALTEAGPDLLGDGERLVTGENVLLVLLKSVTAQRTSLTRRFPFGVTRLRGKRGQRVRHRQVAFP
jgi:uncharacterized protein YbjT (DUF2867 family)